LPKYGKPIWKIVLEAAERLDAGYFTPKDVIDEAHKMYPEIPDTSLRTYVIAMAPNHPSSPHYPSTRKNHPYFKYHKSGVFSLNFTLTPPDDGGNNGPEELSPKEVFLTNYQEHIIKWTKENYNEIITARKEYSWNEKPMSKCVMERNLLQSEIVKSRIRNGSGVDLNTINQIMDWGGLRHIRLSEDKAIKITSESFESLDSGDLKTATIKLLSVYGMGIASASKIIGLYDQNRFAIYDSRVGTALRSLTIDGERLIKCPPGRTRSGDACTDKKWAENYVYLTWTLEIMSQYLSKNGYPFNLADVEMALFMMGK